MRDLTTWTVLQSENPNRLELRCNALPVALITSGCVLFSAHLLAGPERAWRGAHALALFSSDPHDLALFSPDPS